MGLVAMIFVFWMLSFKPAFSLSPFTFIKRLFSFSSLSAIMVVSSAYLRLLIFLPAILIPACASSSPLLRYNWCIIHCVCVCVCIQTTLYVYKHLDNFWLTHKSITIIGIMSISTISKSFPVLLQVLPYWLSPHIPVHHWSPAPHSQGITDVLIHILG